MGWSSRGGGSTIALMTRRTRFLALETVGTTMLGGYEPPELAFRLTQQRLGHQPTKARPIQLPAAVQTTLVARVPIHLADAPDWELRAARVSAPGEPSVQCQDGWPVPDG